MVMQVTQIIQGIESHCKDFAFYFERNGEGLKCFEHGSAMIYVFKDHSGFCVENSEEREEQGNY